MPLIHGIDIINIWNFDLSLELDNTWFYTPYTILIDVDKKIKAEIRKSKPWQKQKAERQIRFLRLR